MRSFVDLAPSGVPAKTRILGDAMGKEARKIPAFAGMTSRFEEVGLTSVIPANAGISADTGGNGVAEGRSGRWSDGPSLAPEWRAT
jgi:hypothetical protein